MADNQPSEPTAFTIRELHKRVPHPGLTKKYRHFDEGLLRGWREGRHIYIPASELTAYPERLARLHEQGQR
jgi:hypothetical protein